MNITGVMQKVSMFQCQVSESRLNLTQHECNSRFADLLPTTIHLQLEELAHSVFEHRLEIPLHRLGWWMWTAHMSSHYLLLASRRCMKSKEQRTRVPSSYWREDDTSREVVYRRMVKCFRCGKASCVACHGRNLSPVRVQHYFLHIVLGATTI